MIWKIGWSRTNPSSEVDFPALKFQRVRLFSKIPFHGENSPIIHHTTVRISSTSMIGPYHFNFGSGVIEHAHSTVPNSWGEDAKNLWNVEDCRGLSFLNKSSFTETFPVTPLTTQCITRQSRIAARQESGTRKWKRLDQERGSLQSCSQIQDRKILLHLTKIPCSVNPELGPIPLLLHGQFFNSRLSCMISFIATNSSRFFIFFGTSLHDLHGRAFSIKSNSPFKLLLSL